MNDMSAVIIPKSDQINADDLIAGPRTFRIEAVDIRAGTEQPVSIHLAGEERVWRPCKSMSRVLVAAWGPDANAYKGRSITLYNDPRVKWGGMEVGGIRVSHLSDIDREMLLQLTATKGKRAPHIVKPLVEQTRTAPQQADDPAMKWANAYIAKVEAVTTIEELTAFETERAAKLAELGKKRPELHERCVTAAQARGSALAQEGKPNGDFGDPFTDDTPDPRAATSATIRAHIEAGRFDEADALLDEHGGALEDGEALNAMLAKARGA